MHKMNNLEYSFIVKELSTLAGKHFSRIRKIAEGIYRMKIGSVEIICEAGVRLHATKYMEEPRPHDRFVEKVGKELDNAKLLSVEQVNMDRIISFNFDRGTLIFEMFGQGNIILVMDNRTVTAYRYESWAGREIKRGAPYSPPTTKPSEVLKPSERYIIVSLMKLPLGKEYALEALSRLKIDEKTPGDSLSRKKIEMLEAEIGAMRDSAKPHLFLDKGKPVDFSLARLSRFSGLEAKEHATLSEAADEYYHILEEPKPALEKLQRRLEKQKERLAKLIEDEKSYKKTGDYIYEHYQEVEGILHKAKAGEGKLDKKEKSVEADI